MIAVGIVFVLLLGEIDLSVGSVSGLARRRLRRAERHARHERVARARPGHPHRHRPSARCHGFFFAKIGVPAFVVTLAGLLGWNGLMLWLLGGNGTINIPDTTASSPSWPGSYFMDQARRRLRAWPPGRRRRLLRRLSFGEQRRRKAAGVPFRPTERDPAAHRRCSPSSAFVAAYVLNQCARCLPLALVIFLAVLVIADFVLRRTTYGRKIFAVGGGIEAARRAGINVPMVRISVFAISGGFAAIGGLFLAGPDRRRRR